MGNRSFKHQPAILSQDMALSKLMRVFPLTVWEKTQTFYFTFSIQQPKFSYGDSDLKSHNISFFFPIQRMILQRNSYE